MSVLPTFLVTGAGTSAGFVTPRAAHTVLQRGSQQSAWGSSLTRPMPRPSGPACLLARAARPCSLVLTGPQPESVACEPRKEVEMDVVEAFTVREEEMDAVASACAEP